MIRVSTIYVGICMVLITASLGVVLYSLVGIDGFAATMVSLVALTFLVLYQAIALRMRDRTDSSHHIVDLSRGTADLARQLAEMSRRLAVAESKLAASTKINDKSQTALDEITELGELVTQLTATVALHDDTLAAIIAIAEPARPEAVELIASDTVNIQPALEFTSAVLLTSDVSEQLPPESGLTESGLPETVSDAPPVAASQVDLAGIVANAIAAGRIDLYLQPILTLPQRKVRFYEAMTRLRDDDDKLMIAADFVDQAASAGLIGQIDNIMIERSMQVLQRITKRNKDIGIFCNVAAETLADRATFLRCIDFMDTSRALASSLILEFRQNTIRSLGPVAREHLAALAQRGFRFSMDHVTDFKFDPRELADLGIRHIKVSAELLLQHHEAIAGDIHPADLADLLARFGIDLIAEKIETDRAVVDILDCDVRFGQGYLFAAPKPLRPENAAVEEPSKAPTKAAAPDRQESHAPAKTAASSLPKGETRLTGNAALVRRALSAT